MATPGASRHQRLHKPLAMIALASAAWLTLSLGLLAVTLEPPQRSRLAHEWLSRGAILALLWALGLLAAYFALRRWWLPRATVLPELTEQVRAIVSAAQPLYLAERAQPDEQGLVDAVHALAQQRDQLRDDVAAEVARASASARLERNRFAALMAELAQSVVVCNRNGRILLYNQRARLQFRALSDAPQLAGGAELIGIGRSIYAVLDQQLVAHALDRIGQRLARGASLPSAQFVTTTRGGQLLRVQVAPVTDVEAEGDGATPLRGFVLMLDNITRSYEEVTAHGRALQQLAEDGRASLAALRSALERLGCDGQDPAARQRCEQLVRSEIAVLAERIEGVAQQSADSLRARWPLEDMQAAEFLELAARQMSERCGVPVTAAPTDMRLWLRLDSFSMLHVLVALGHRLVDECGVPALTLRLTERGARAQLDLVWTGRAMNTETAMSWQMDPMRIGGDSSPLSVRDVMERHDAEMGFERHPASHQAFFRFRWPLVASAQMASEQLPAVGSRPEFFDFDLFAQAETDAELDERPLSTLAYTVFDTETTGLNPSGGDEIIQIGATRVVNGRLLRQESFEQLVDPGRDIPKAGAAIHGVTPDMVAGQPRIDDVFPAFHQFAQDTVLVAHNAAFDMKFLQAPARRTGLRLQQPVLDTLLLSAVVHPHQASHRLEAIAERFGITVLGRHTALGDALVTAEVLLRLIPLLRDMGIVTLAQARAAAQRSYYARLKY